MKGIAHFTAGVAAASCFPAAVEAGARGNPLYFILGGVFGLLPDTLDFKIYRFIYPHHVEITPDPLRPNPGLIADSLANAVGMARENGQPVRVKLNTIRLGVDLWQRYSVTFNVPRQSVDVRYGPVVNTGGSTVRATEPTECTVGRADLPCATRIDYLAVTTVDILDGPVFEMTPGLDGRVTARFIPWHREWSHSFVVALLFALAAAAVWTPLAGMIVFAAYGLHMLADQLGFMGSALWFPFNRRRIPGLGLMNSAEPSWNVTAVWLSCIVIFWNLYSHAQWHSERFNFITLCFYALALPAGMVALVRRWLRKNTP